MTRFTQIGGGNRRAHHSQERRAAGAECPRNKLDVALIGAWGRGTACRRATGRKERF
jgi:hypothetical protein